MAEKSIGFKFVYIVMISCFFFSGLTLHLLLSRLTLSEEFNNIWQSTEASVIEMNDGDHAEDDFLYSHQLSAGDSMKLVVIVPDQHLSCSVLSISPTLPPPKI
jgi:hypothetical protein